VPPNAVVIVGHGPSVLSGLGAVIDAHTVVRLKRGLLETHDRSHWGSRTDYLCARSPGFDHGRFPFWLARGEYPCYRGKPTTGLCAVLECIERLQPDSIALIGFDRLLYPDTPDPPHTWLAHDKHAEHACLHSLGVRITDLRTHGEVR
jgi:hypothetical protein